MRSFAFSSIQDQRAELERGRQRKGGKEAIFSSSHPSACLFIRPSVLHSFRDRQIPAGPPPLLSPATFGSGYIWFASVIPWVVRVLLFGLICFWYPLKKKKKSNKQTVWLPFVVWVGFRVKDQPLNKAFRLEGISPGEGLAVAASCS